MSLFCILCNQSCCCCCWWWWWWCIKMLMLFSDLVIKSRLVKYQLHNVISFCLLPLSVSLYAYVCLCVSVFCCWHCFIQRSNVCQWCQPDITGLRILQPKMPSLFFKNVIKNPWFWHFLHFSIRNISMLYSSGFAAQNAESLWLTYFCQK